MLKIVKRTIIPALLLGVGLLIGSTVMTSSANTGLIGANQPGSVNDPVVTKSYVDKKLAEIGVSSPVPQTGTGTIATLNVIQLKKGHSLIAFEGTEFIVRNGKAVGFSKTTDDIPNLTTGEGISAGVVIPNNHLLLFPRNDGRGIKHNDGDAVTVYVMVRGSYEHLDATGKQIAKK